MKTYQIIYYSIIVVGCIVGLSKWGKLQQATQLGVGLLFYTLISELTAMFVSKHSESNLWVYHIFIPIQFVIVTYSYWIELRLGFMKVIIWVFPIVSVFVSLFVQNSKFPSYAITFSGILYILWALLFFRELLIQADEDPVFSYPLFWISLGWLQFGAITLFPFGIFNYFVKNPLVELVPIFKNFRIGANWVLYSCYCAAFLSKQKSIFK